MPSYAQLLEDFKAFDFNGDGIIDAGEWLAILQRGGENGELDEATAEFMLKSIAKSGHDVDGDGVVTISELAMAMAEDREKYASASGSGCSPEELARAERQATKKAEAGAEKKEESVATGEHTRHHPARAGSMSEEAAPIALWPAPIFDKVVQSPGGYEMATQEQHGTTPHGTPWTYREGHARDNEDNDRSYAFTLGDLAIHRDDDVSRDFATDETVVKYKGKEIYKSGDKRSRDNKNEPMTSTGVEALKEVLAAVAAEEGVTPQQLAKALPIGLPGVAH